MTIRNALVIALLVSLLVLSGAANAHGGKRGWGGGPWHALDLSDAQKQAVARIMKEHRTGLRAKKDRLAEARRELRTVKSAESWDEAAVSTALDGVAAARKAVTLVRFAMRRQMRAVLTAAQLETASLRRAKFMARKERRREKRRARQDAWIEKHAG